MKPAAERFWQKVSGGDVDTCWTWTAATNGVGYGWLKSNGRTTTAHRWAYEQLIGPVPAGLDLDHLCRNRACVNPWHLDPVTRRINLLRGDTIPARKAAQTHCVHGHLLDSANTQIKPNGNRSCRTCTRERARVYRAARKSA